MSEPSRPSRLVVRGWLLFILQVGVSVGLLVWLLSGSEFLSEWRDVLAKARWGWCAGGVALAGLVQWLCLIRWQIFLKMAGVKIGSAQAASAFFAGLFAGLFLPGGAGGDVVKVGLLTVRGNDVARSTLSVVMDRLCGAFSLILVGGALIFWHRDWLMQSAVVAPVMGGVVVYLLVLALVLSLSLVLCAKGIVARLPEHWPGRKRFVELTGAYFQLAVQWKKTLGAVGISALMLLLYFLTFFFAAEAFGAGISAGQVLAIMPAVDVIAALPVSFGGLGLRETVFTLLAGQLLGIAAATAVTISLAGYLFSAVWALPGAVLWMWRGRSA